MFHHLKASEITKSASGTRTFQGAPYHAGVSFFLEEDQPGAGPKLHSTIIPRHSSWSRAPCASPSVTLMSTRVLAISSWSRPARRMPS